MNRRQFLVALVVGALAPSAQADSIWARRDPRYANLFQDNRARQVGDVLTVIVSENTNANEREQRALDKQTDMSGQGQFTGNTSATGVLGRQAGFSLNLTDTFRRRFNGSAQLTSNRVFLDRLAVTVVDVMPNGNLVIEGYRSRVVAGEERVLRITGVVRPADIGIGNAVQSSAIANCRVSYLGRGPESRTVNQSYLSRALNLIWPW